MNCPIGKCNRGEMSFVGPRPSRPFFVNELRQAHRTTRASQSVPGYTGWAQVEDRTAPARKTRFRKLEYRSVLLKQMSFVGDLPDRAYDVSVVSVAGFGGR